MSVLYSHRPRKDCDYISPSFGRKDPATSVCRRVEFLRSDLTRKRKRMSPPVSSLLSPRRQSDSQRRLTSSRREASLFAKASSLWALFSLSSRASSVALKMSAHAFARSSNRCLTVGMTPGFVAADNAETRLWIFMRGDQGLE